MKLLETAVAALTLLALAGFAAPPATARADARPAATQEEPTMTRTRQPVTTPTEDIVLVRTFDAPVERVWRAWTEPEQVMRWWGPKLYTSHSCKIDFREGGRYVFHMRAPQEHGGQDHYTTGVFSKIVPLSRIEMTQGLSDVEGRAIAPASIGMPPEFPAEIPTLVTFKSVAGKTTVSVVEKGWTPGPMRDYSEAGMSECLDKLAESLSKP